MSSTPQDRDGARPAPRSARASAGSSQTLPTDPVREAPLSLLARDAVVSLRVVGTTTELLLPERPTFTLGSKPEPDVDVHVSSSMRSGDRRTEHVSGVHLLVQRKGKHLWIRDQGTTNGTHIEDHLETEGAIVAGRVFRVGDVALLPMDPSMRELRRHLQWVLGFGAHAYVDKVLPAVTTGAPLLLLGAGGCEQRLLAEEIHRTSSRRHRSFVRVTTPLTSRAEQVSHLAHADRGTLFVDLAEFKMLPAFFVQHLFGEQYHVRPIIAAPDYAAATRLLGDVAVACLRMIAIPAIRDRREDVPRLLDTFFRRIEAQRRRNASHQDDHEGVKRQVAELGADAVARLVQFDWPHNFADLERTAPRLLALIESGGNVRAAARALGISHKALGDALRRVMSK